MKNDHQTENLESNTYSPGPFKDKTFDQFFSALTDNGPFKWQRRLFNGFIKGEIPAALDIPTGLGKTSVMTIWLLARTWNPLLPRRLVYIVDRRVVVDQATTVAEKLRDSLLHRPECAEIAEKLGVDRETPLPISTLRGQLADNRAWLEDTTRPAIIIGTVDMIGSRLLFSGYRASRWIRPIQAALIGVDSLIVLDEAHLVPAFDHVLACVASQRQKETPPVALPPLHILPLSATSRPMEGAEMFRLEAEDLEDNPVSLRLNATKRLEMIEIDGKLPDKLCTRAFAHDGKSRTVIVFCNGRNVAQKTAEALRKELGKERADDVRLLTGARRGHERDKLAESATFKAFQGKCPEDGRTRYLVCTAAGEVGADLDAQNAVMDLVSLERMIQRLGRVNRRGEAPGGSSVDVLLEASRFEMEDDSGMPDLNAVCELLLTLPEIKPGVWNATSWAINEVLKKLPPEKRRRVLTPEPPIPPFDRAHVEAWSMTSLEEHPGRPEVAPFLRGIVDERPQTELVWRADVPLLARLEPAKLAQALEATSPRPSEILEEEAFSAVEKLLGRIENLPRKAEEADASSLAHLAIIVARGEKVIEILTISKNGLRRKNGAFLPADLKKQKEILSRLVSYATVWLPCELGGLDADGLFASNTGDPVIEPPRDDFTHLRLVVALNTKAASPIGCDWPEGINPGDNWEDQLRKKRWRRIFSATVPPPDSEGDEDPTQRLEYWAPSKASRMDGETSAGPKAQSLAEHLGWVEKEVALLADALRLPEWLKEALRIAARLHDGGKGRELWQHAMRADRESESLKRPLAKTTNRGSGNLGGYRHEFGSLMGAIGNSDFLSLNPEQRELVLHLIAAHHGRSRPNIPAIDPDVIVPAALEKVSLDAAKCFARLQRLWGPWGLAWLETLLRSADAKSSRRLEENYNG